MIVPTIVLKQLYTRGSLDNTKEGVQFSIKNRLSDARLTGIESVYIDDREIPKEQISLVLSESNRLPVQSVTHDHPVDFPLGRVLDITMNIDPLEVKKHSIKIHFDTTPFGKLKLRIDDSIMVSNNNHLTHIPRDDKNDYSEGIIKTRQQFVEEYSGKKLEHINHYSFDPEVAIGNIEHFTGVAQIPLGFAGPIKINGDHAQGEFIIPLATSEGTLVASYNRGAKVLNLCGGVTCTVVGDNMQRAPVFVFENAREGRRFVDWVNQHIDQIRTVAESTSSVAKLKHIDYYLSNKFAYLRFNYTTGDAAGMNMVGKATYAACGWILDHYPPEVIKNFYLESNLATDKKSSQINLMKTRGKRVTAEAVVKRDILLHHMHVEPEMLNYHSNVANVGAILSGANNNGCHSANAITAMFIATGQDVANVAESSSAILYSELTPEGDLYLSITIPSLIVASYGGGTGLATQRECLEILGCYGKGKVNKLAEIIAGVALAGELSLGSAISSSDWVVSHERFGRNR